MITSLQLIDFKNFASETLRIGPFTVIVGTNASGKSNIRDGFRFLHGIGRGYTLADIIGGKYGSGGQREWAPIRGTADEIIRFGESAFALRVTMEWTHARRRHRGEKAKYHIKVGSDAERFGSFRVMEEELVVGPDAVFSSHPGHPDPVHVQRDDTRLLLRMGKTGSQKKYGHRLEVRPEQPAITQIHEHKKVVRGHKDSAERIIDVFGNMRFLDLEPNRMRQAAFPGQTVLGDRGDNLPTVLREICTDPKRKETLAAWTRELTPMDVRDFEFPTDPTTGRVQLVFHEASDRKVSAHGASDGTLRFLAMLAALLGANPARLYVFEEIDNGIHPARLRLLLDLIERQVSKGASRVVTTTHSPDLVSMVSDETFANASVVCRPPGADDAVIRRIADLSGAVALRRSQGLRRLHASGWMEDAITFTQQNPNEDESE